MKILFFTEGRFTPTSRFRVEQYIAYFEKEGISCKVIEAVPSKYGIILKFLNFTGGRFISTRITCLFSTLKRFFDVFYYPSKFDMVFVQRDLSFMLKSPILESIIYKKNPNIIFDFDDFICMKSEYDNNVSHERKIRKIIDFSKTIIVGNKYLKNWVAEDDKTIFIPTSVDTLKFVPNYCKHKVSSSKIVIGWTGTSSNFPYLLSIKPVLEKLLCNNNIEIRFISNKPLPELQYIGARFIKWSPSSEVRDLQEFDIGLAPLFNNQWTSGKCALKVCLYMSVGMPVVVSPIGHVNEIVEDGVDGFFANDDKEWYDKINMLVNNPDLRVQMGLSGRNKIEKQYSVSTNLAKYIEIFSDSKG